MGQVAPYGSIARPLVTSQPPNNITVAAILYPRPLLLLCLNRRLQTAASDGNIDGAESAFAGMEAAGMPPGPRAFHVLLCAYLKGGDTPGALGVAGRATEAGVWSCEGGLGRHLLQGMLVWKRFAASTRPPHSKGGWSGGLVTACAATTVVIIKTTGAAASLSLSGRLTSAVPPNNPCWPSVVAACSRPAGVQLLSESYAVLIYAAMETNPPDVNIAKTLYGSLSGTDTDPQLPWSTLCRLLAAKGFGAEAVAAVKEGLRGGLEMDADVAEAYLKGLCDTEQLVSAGVWVAERVTCSGARQDGVHLKSAFQ